MKIAIHHRSGSFSHSWIEYCREQGIDYKLVNCYDTDIVRDTEDCHILLWHFHQAHEKDVLCAKQILFSLQAAGKIVYPDFNTNWHFDDKVAQKYLLESISADMVKSYVFYDKSTAKEWALNTSYPKVFKLRKGASSSSVRLVKSKSEAFKLIYKAFNKGFRHYEPATSLKERWRKYRLNISGIKDVLKGIMRFGYTTDFDRFIAKEKGYVYFQDFIPDNKSDLRVIVINNRAFAIRRLVRENDFRASGSGLNQYDKELIPEKAIDLSFKLAEKIGAQSLAVDLILHGSEHKIIEISYGYLQEVYTECAGYWDRNLKWHECSFDPQKWIIEALIDEYRE